MVSRKAIRLVAASALALALASCQEEYGIAPSAKAIRPLKPEMIELMKDKGMRKEDPILIRVFKQDSVLEVWKRDKTGKFALLKDYKICAWGGTVGPKIREGDKQSPEGFYTVTPWRMNPNSQFHLSFDVGYPNAFDRAYGRTGAAIMVHGACSSAGCFAMTDAQVEEIYGLAREAFAGGQPSFQVQSFPFRMTPQNLAKHRSSPHYAFWKNLKEGHDHFEVTKLEPKVDVCEKRYVFNAQPKDASSTTFNAAGACPDYEIPAHIAMAVGSKSKDDETEVKTLVTTLEEKEKAAAEAELAAKMEAAKPKQEGGSVIASMFGAKPSEDTTASVAPNMTPINVPVPRPAPGRVAAPPTTVAAKEKADGGMFDNLFSFGSKAETEPTTLAAPPAPPPPAARPAPAPAATATTAAATTPRAAPAAAPAAVASNTAPAPTAEAPKPEQKSWWQRVNPFGS